jgi:protein-tyrosine phosphatase
MAAPRGRHSAGQDPAGWVACPGVDRFRTVFVCTGNICRSPTAERLLRARLTARLGASAGRFEVGSVGTLDLSGAAMDPFAAAALSELGGDPAGHRARQLAPADLDLADLVLGMTREHRGATIRTLPRVAPRAFTLLEFARYCGAVDPDRLPAADPVVRARAAVASAALNRGVVAPRHPEEDDLADPLGGPPETFSATALAISAALEPFLKLLSPTDSTRQLPPANPSGR